MEDVDDTSEVVMTPSTAEALEDETPTVPSISLAECFHRGAGMPPRPQQVQCLEAICSALVSDADSPVHASNYLVQHATGSGKSLTIASLAYALTSLVDARGNRFSLVLIVSDRKVLDTQLYDTVSSFFSSQEGSDDDLCQVEVERAESCDHLRSVIAAAPLEGGRTRVVVTTFQKAGARGGGGRGAEGGGVGDDAMGRSASGSGGAAAARDGSTRRPARGPCSSHRVAILC